MTPFALLAAFAGLSHREAAELLRVRLDTVKSWSAGRNAAPEGALAELRALIAGQECAAAEAVAELGRRMGPLWRLADSVEIGAPADDAEARALGFPCVGAWRAMAARVVARAPLAVRLVPRGTTLATAAAADARDRL